MSKVFVKVMYSESGEHYGVYDTEHKAPMLLDNGRTAVLDEENRLALYKVLQSEPTLQFVAVTSYNLVSMELAEDIPAEIAAVLENAHNALMAALDINEQLDAFHQQMQSYKKMLEAVPIEVLDTKGNLKPGDFLMVFMENMTEPYKSSVRGFISSDKSMRLEWQRTRCRGKKEILEDRFLESMFGGKVTTDYDKVPITAACTIPLKQELTAKYAKELADTFCDEKLRNQYAYKGKGMEREE